jgi:hypothetical protein
MANIPVHYSKPARKKAHDFYRLFQLFVSWPTGGEQIGAAPGVRYTIERKST